MSTTTFATTQDYIEQNIAPGLGDIDLTNDQALEVAQRMTEWNNNGELTEREDVDLWDVVADVTGDN